MTRYDIFEQTVPPESKAYFNEDLAQTTALHEASNLIHEAMEEKGLNQSQLAEMMGVSRAYVSRLLSGSENMSVRNIARILHLLGKRYIQDMNNTPGESTGCTVYNYAEYKNASIKVHIKEESHLNNVWNNAVDHG